MSPSADSRGAVVSYWQKYVQEVLVNRLGGLSLPRKSVVRLTYRPNMTLDVYRGRKTTVKQNTLFPAAVNSAISATNSVTSGAARGTEAARVTNSAANSATTSTADR